MYKKSLSNNNRNNIIKIMINISKKFYNIQLMILTLLIKNLIKKKFNC